MNQRKSYAVPLLAVLAVAGLLGFSIFTGLPPAEAGLPPGVIFKAHDVQFTGGAAIFSTTDNTVESYTFTYPVAVRFQIGVKAGATPGQASYIWNGEPYLFKEGGDLAAGCAYTFQLIFDAGDTLDMEFEETARYSVLVQEVGEGL